MIANSTISLIINCIIGLVTLGFVNSNLRFIRTFMKRKGANRMNLINRQDLQYKIDCVDRLEMNVDGQKIEVIPRWNVNAIIESMPSAEQKGQWEYLYDGSRKCSNCGSWWEFEYEPDKEGVNYCPNCGCKMERGEEE